MTSLIINCIQRTYKSFCSFVKPKKYRLDCIPVTMPVKHRHSSQRKKNCWRDRPENRSLTIGIIIWPHANRKIWYGWKKQVITDDFTMGYPDVAGFRLGTSRPVHWINPENKRISPLILHPLAIMECSLNEPVYMNLDYEGHLLLNTTHQTGGICQRRTGVALA